MTVVTGELLYDVRDGRQITRHDMPLNSLLFCHSLLPPLCPGYYVCIYGMCMCVLRCCVHVLLHFYDAEIEFERREQ